VRLLAWPAFRFYYQFSDTWNTAIYLQRDVLPGEDQTGSSSLAYSNKTQVPSTLLKSFGVEFLEVAQNNVELFNFTVKVQEA
jgi:hypothetical protein